MLVDADISSPCSAPSTATNKIIVTPNKERLADVAEPSTSLVIWERHLPRALESFFTQIEADQLPRGRVLADRDHLDSAVDSFFETCEATDGNAASALRQDIVSLGNSFGDIAKTTQVDIRLEVIEHDACWKFHLDQVSLRLVTTYCGEGTQYVLPEFSAQALHDQKDYGGPIEQIAAPSVALFKGAHSRPGSGIVHRSPPASSFSGARLLLCINAPSEASPELWKPGNQ